MTMEVFIVPHALVPVSTLLFNRNIIFVEKLDFTGF